MFRETPLIKKDNENESPGLSCAVISNLSSANVAESACQKREREREREREIVASLPRMPKIDVSGLHVLV